MNTKLLFDENSNTLNNKLKEASITDTDQEALSKELVTSQTEITQDTAVPYVQSIHDTYQIEQMMLDMVRRGDTLRLKEWMSQIPEANAGKVAADTLRQEKNIFIISTTLTSRAAIRGGMDLEDALHLSDSYIQKCEKLNDLVQIKNLQYHMVLQYASAVEEIRYNRNQSELIRHVASYIRHHLSDAIKTEDIAASLFMSRSYLSTKFKKETGMNLNDYIHYIKVSEAKHLLTYTDKNVSVISIYLGYSSQSHFTRVFKRITGESPAEYRETSQKTH